MGKIPYTDAGARAPLQEQRLATHFESIHMSTPAKPDQADSHHTPDATEAIVPLIPIVLPLVGGVLMFLLAFIAVSMA